MNCFVVMPFGNEKLDQVHFRKMEDLYSDWIKPTVESLQIPGSGDETVCCHRADKEPGPGDIVDHIIESLVTADIVIADLTGKNANVFYELGVRHAVSSATILLAEGIEHIPFDVGTLRAIVYEYTPPGMLKLQRALRDALMTILANRDKIDNPVRRFLYRRETTRLMTQKVPPGFDAVRNLVDEVTRLRAEVRRQFFDFRSLIETVTVKPTGVRPTKPEDVADGLEGVWRSDDGSTVCMKVVGNELRVPYCYGGSDKLTAHHYNCHLVGDLLMTRFEWFSFQVSGFSVYRLESDDLLIGGWCYTADFPYLSKSTPPVLSPELPGLEPAVLRRELQAVYPSWADEYFRRYA
jgi:hypothetical protein